MLRHRTNCRTFQQITVPDILKQVLTGFDVTYQVQGTFQPRDYCVQYRETDFDFASRLMEEEGIYYFFKHTRNGRQMVLANTPQATPPSEAGRRPSRSSRLVQRTSRTEDRVLGWEKSQEVRAGKTVLHDNCFELPGDNLEATRPVPPDVTAGTGQHKLKAGGNSAYELYDYPGGYAQRFDGIDRRRRPRRRPAKISPDGKRTVGIRMAQETLPAVLIVGDSDCRQFASGHKFTLKGHPNADGAYVLTAPGTHGQHRGNLHHQQPADAGLRQPLRLHPARRCRSSRRGPRPSRRRRHADGRRRRPAGRGDLHRQVRPGEGPVPLGPAGQEGRRQLVLGPRGDALGRQAVGHDPHPAHRPGGDRRLRGGRPRPADHRRQRLQRRQMPPYTLPDNKTQSGVKSRSSLKGGAENFNEICFEDKKGEELLYIHAEKDQKSRSRTTRLTGSATIAPRRWTTTRWSTSATTARRRWTTRRSDQERPHETVDTTRPSRKNDRTESAHVTTMTRQGNEKVTIAQGNRTVEVSTGNESLTVEQGNRTVEISMGNESLTIKMGNQTTKLDLGTSTTEAMQSIELKVGQSSVKVDQMGVTIKGMMISINGQIQTEVKGMMTTITGSAMLQETGGIILIG